MISVYHHSIDYNKSSHAGPKKPAEVILIMIYCVTAHYTHHKWDLWEEKTKDFLLLCGAWIYFQEFRGSRNYISYFYYNWGADNFTILRHFCKGQSDFHLAYKYIWGSFHSLRRQRKG